MINAWCACVIKTFNCLFDIKDLVAYVPLGVKILWLLLFFIFYFFGRMTYSCIGKHNNPMPLTYNRVGLYVSWSHHLTTLAS